MGLISLKNLQNQNPQKNKEKALTFENAIRILKGRQNVLNGFVSKKIPIAKQTYGEEPKILTPTQMLKILPTALAEVKAGNTSENLLNEIQQIMYSLY